VYAHPVELAENTMKDSTGLSLGADGVELDVHLSRDGEVVICGDMTLNERPAPVPLPRSADELSG
jgi:hypothetical protein